MAEDRSLDEFLGVDEPSDPDTTEGAAGPDASEEFPTTDTETDEGADQSAEHDAAEPEVETMAETFAWSPDGGECAVCGERIEERWRDDGGLVCGDCKAW